MKVILVEDIKGVGKKGDILNASEGHARNFLLPKGLAVEANNSNINELNLKKRSEDIKKQKEMEEAKKLCKEIENKEIKIYVTLGDNGKLFGSVTNKEICKALEYQTGIKIDKKKIILKETIKNLGEIIANVKINAKIVAKLKVHILNVNDKNR